MRKKTFKIFINSFVISLFVIWSANELFAIPQKTQSKEISIPDKNIALFFQQESPMVNYVSSTPVDSFSLAAPKPKPIERELMIDEGLFVFDEPEEPGIKISSIEDVADIPLEEQTVQNKTFSTSSAQNDLPESPTLAQKETSSDTNQYDAITDIAPNLDDKTISSDIVSDTTLVASNATAQNNLQDDDVLIPLEFSNTQPETNIEIATQAPNNQIAMADGAKVDIDGIAVEQKEEMQPSAQKEWYEMSEKQPNDSPWLVARGTRNPKNNHVLEEDFYKGISESEIAAALNKPQTMAEDNKEVQVAEMVKNILIPIPEDILNDKNLTPQLVSPKKLKKAAEESTSEEITSDAEEPKHKEGGILKSLTSIFTGSEDDASSEDENSEAGEEEDATPKKHRGLFSVFGSKKSPAKILPAEMRLSFQPGRAEISGTTLRWIQAFANKVIEDPSVILEIRIDRTSSFELQQKRLNLLHNILTNKGVDYGRINTVFTSREPNSFIIRTLRINDNVNNTVQENKKGQALYYQSW